MTKSDTKDTSIDTIAEDKPVESKPEEKRQSLAVASTGASNVLAEHNDALNNINFEDYQNEFDENVNASSELKISRAAIMQPGSPEIGGAVPGYSAGMLVDNFTRDILTQEFKSPWLKGKVPDEDLFKCHACLIIPAFKLPSEFIKWKDLKTEGRGWHFKSMDRNDPRVREGLWANAGGTWGTKPDQAGPPPVTENCNYMCVVLQVHQILENNVTEIANTGIIFSFSKTSFGAGRKLTTYIKKGFQNNVPSFGNAYWCFTKKERNEESNSFYYYIDIAPAGRSSSLNEQSLEIAYKWHKSFAGNRELQNAYLSAAAIDEHELSNEGETEETENSDGTPF